MSKNIGRNSPCHCGSGKKYKKCCLIQDEEKARLEQNPDLLYEKDEYSEKMASDDESESLELISNFTQPEIQQESKPELILSETTSEEEKIINDWFDIYRKITDPDKFLDHLNYFLVNHPKLVHHLGLEEEVLFELQALLLRYGREDEYIEVLLAIRVDYPEIYLQSFSYYDRDLIAYYISKGELNKASEFIAGFIVYPDDNPDILFTLVDFLCVSNQQALLAGFLEKIYLQVLYSKNIIGAGQIIEPYLWACHFIPKLETSFDEKSALELSKTFKALDIDLIDELYQPEFLLQKMNQITKDIEESLIEKFEKTKVTLDFYYEISSNFIGWLHKHKNIPWLTGSYFQRLIFQYFVTSIPKNKKPKSPFLFIKSHFERNLHKMSDNFISVDAVTILSSLRAFYWFNEYLLEHNAITEEEAHEFQGWCKDINAQVLPELLKNQFEAKYFINDILSKNQ